jgi:hypothetical protein
MQTDELTALSVQGKFQACGQSRTSELTLLGVEKSGYRKRLLGKGPSTSRGL